MSPTSLVISKLRILFVVGFVWAYLPASSLHAVEPPSWCGGVTASQATVKALLRASGVPARLVVSERADLSAPLYSPAVVSSAASGNVVSLVVTGLRPATTYYYALESNGTLDRNAAGPARFATFPEGPASFKFAMGGDSDYRKFNQAVFETIAAENPLFFLFLGDLHYNNTNVPRVGPYRANYAAVLAVPSFRKLLRSTSLVYVWDDHDCAGNDTDRTRAGVPFARRAYREYVPSYPLTSAGGTINQAFSVGRARFIVTDNQSDRDPSAKPDDARKTMLGAEQKAWFKSELLAAKASPACKLIFWVCSNPWIGKPLPNTDRWQSYSAERREIADFLKTNDIRNLCILSADMHALVYDDGTNSDYATGGGMPLPVLHAAPLAKTGSSKGGPYSSGEPIQPVPNSGQYGIVEVTDDGGPAVSVNFLGKRTGASPGVMLKYQFTVR